MANIKLLKKQMANSRELFKVTDRLRKYLSGSELNSEDPDTGEEIKIYFDDPNTIRLNVYRRNHYVLERIYKRTGEMSDFTVTAKW